MTNVIVRYKGLNCFGETDELSASDEIYLFTTATAIQDGQAAVRTEKHPVDAGVYPDVDAGASFGGPIAPCYAGPLRDLSLGVTVMEQDEGDPNAFKGEVDAAVKAAAVAAAAAGVPVPEVAQQLLGGAVNALLGSGDDVIGQAAVTFTAAELLAEASKPRQEERGVSHTFSTFHSDGEASYKAYFDVLVEADLGQGNWRFCGRCMGLFFDGDPDHKGACPAGGAHASIGLNFELPHDRPAHPHEQSDWRFCGRCSGLFFDGDPDHKGSCPAGGPHASIGHVFNLAHDVPPTPGEQTEWRFCGGCRGLFYDGDPAQKGTCPAGGHHAAIGFVFNLQHT